MVAGRAYSSPRIITASPLDCKHFEASAPAHLKVGIEARPKPHINGQMPGLNSCSSYWPLVTDHCFYAPKALSINVMGLSSALAPWNWIGPGKR